MSLFSIYSVQAEESGDQGITEEVSESLEDLEEFEVEENDQPFDPDDQVRVIVEVDEIPGITYATQQGVEYNQLDESTREEIESNAEIAQENVQNQIDNLGIESEYYESFSTVLNGFSAEVPYGQIERIEELPGVSRVEIANEYERPEILEPDMVGSVEQVLADISWEEYGATGEGLVVGVIDSGVDPTHQDMVLSDDVEFAIDEDLVGDLDLQGEYFTDKVPYGYNYFDRNTTIIESASSGHHGMHVAGTVAANGDPEEGGLRGVAPEAQILALRVFSDQEGLNTTFDDLYVAAYDDAVQLGADVLNLSLGSPSGFVNPDSLAQEATQRMVENGIAVTISAGNSSHFGNGIRNPFVTNPDVGLVGSPSVSPASTSVASSDNNSLTLENFDWSAGEYEGSVPYMTAQNAPHEFFNGQVELIYAGYGSTLELEDADVSGKVAVVSRGVWEDATAEETDLYAPFVNKALNAQEAGAIGVIVHNNDGSGFISMASDSQITIPYVFILQDAGLAIKEAIEAGEFVTTEFTGEFSTVESPTAGHLSSFSSWGLTPDLDFKPEIVAPGGDILSTQQDNQYALMSGTSMAAPHVAGGYALLLGHVDEVFGVEGAERVATAKQLLLSTAVPMEDVGTVNEEYELNNYYSPRGQGAGQMDIHAAFSTPAWVTSPQDNDESKVALRSFEESTSFVLEVENFSDEEVLYTIDTSIQTDLASGGSIGHSPDLLESVSLHGENLITSSSPYIVVAPGEVKEVEFAINLDGAEMDYINDTGEFVRVSPSEVYTNGYFVEGFVEFHDPTDRHPSLSVPYVGFNGDWQGLEIIDTDGFYEEVVGASHGTNLIADTSLGLMIMQPTNTFLDENVYVFNPSLYNGVLPNVTFLRNAKELRYNVLDENGEIIRTIATGVDMRKTWGIHNNSYVTANLIADGLWNGTISGQRAEDGRYSYQIEVLPDYPNAEWQAVDFDVVFDGNGPSIDLVVEDGVAKLDVVDSVTGVAYTEVYADGSLVQTFDMEEESHSEEVNLPNGTELVSVRSVDGAGNVTNESVSFATHFEHDDVRIRIAEPGESSTHSTSEVPIAGEIETNAEIESFTVAGQVVDYDYDAISGMRTFDTVITLEDGHHALDYVVVTTSGDEARLGRRVTVDTQAPTIDVSARTITSEEYSSIKIGVTDNFDGVRVYLNDSEIFSSNRTSNEQISLNEEIVESVSLQEGINVFEIRAVDSAGHETTEEIEIERDSNYQTVSRLFGQTRFDTATAVSQRGWESAETVFIANADAFADALSGVALAQEYNAPVLLTPSNTLHNDTRAEIERLNPTEVIILGGDVSVEPAVETQIQHMGITTRRLGGDTRFEVAEAIAQELQTITQPTEAFLVNAHAFADALSIAPFVNGRPVYLTNGNTLTEETAAALNEYSHVYVIGGEASVSPNVLSSLGTTTRLAGRNRYEANLSVLRYFQPSSDELFIATGEIFTDALTGSGLIAKEESGLLLVGNNLNDSQRAYVENNEYSSATIIGGPASVDESILESFIPLLD
jgi:lactocepin